MTTLDDGFQNPSLQKHLAILAIDGRYGIGNGRLFPAGPLRAPLGAQLARAHALVVIGEATGAAAVVAACRARGRKIFHGRLAPDAAAVAALTTRPVLAFAGIGHPEKFFATLDAAGIAAPVRRSFPDHHRYTQRDILEVRQAGKQAGANAFVTTEKDAQNLGGLKFEETPIYVAVIDLVVTPEVDFRNVLDQTLAAGAGAWSIRVSGRSNWSPARQPGTSKRPSLKSSRRLP